MGRTEDQERSKRERIDRIRRRVKAAQSVEDWRGVLQALLDLLGDEL